MSVWVGAMLREKSASEKIEGDANAFQIGAFLRESVNELKKVHSPTRQETVQATMVTLVIMVFVALMLFVLDLVFQSAMHAMLS